MGPSQVPVEYAQVSLVAATAVWLLAFALTTWFAFAEWRASGRLLKDFDAALGYTDISRTEIRPLAVNARRFSFWLFAASAVLLLIGVQAVVVLLAFTPPRPDTSLYTSVLRLEMVAAAICIAMAVYHRRRLRMNTVALVRGGLRPNHRGGGDIRENPEGLRDGE